MRSITAVEIGADTCALASTSVQGAEVRVSAAETLDPAAFPGIDAFTMALQQTRRTLKLPRRCRAVVWGLPDGTTRKDPVVAPLIEPLTRAGFKVARVVTPCNALGALARLRVSRTGGAMCWLGINRNGVAIVVIRPGKLLYSHSFAWDSSVGASGSQARLLQRYSLVAFLAPEVRRAMAAAKQKGTVVEGIVTCGNLPDLRALTMPLIEELDIEVETLDSLEGLSMKPELADKLAEVAPAIRLACAGAFARETRTVDESRRRRVRQTTRAANLLRIAALLAVLGGAGYWWYARKHRPAAPAHSAAVAVPAKKGTPPKTAAPPPATVAKNTPSPAAGPAPLTPTTPAPKHEAPVVTPPAKTVVPPPAASPPAKPVQQTVNPAPPPAKPVPPPKSAPPAARPEPQSTNPVQHAPNPVPQASKPAPPAARPMSEAAKPAAQPEKPLSPPVTPPSAPAKPPATAAPAPLNTLPSRTDKADAASATRPSAKLPELLKDPVPKVTAILVSSDRRLATIGDEGQIIAVGDTIGRRVVVGIDDKTVLLREPSGVQIRVALGGRVVGVERADR